MQKSKNGEKKARIEEWGKSIFERRDFLAKNKVARETEEKLEAEMEEEVMKAGERLGEVTESVQAEQDDLVRQLAF